MATAMPAAEQQQQPWEYCLRKYLLLLATLVATMTYSAGFTPPGGVWQDTAGNHLAGDPIMREVHSIRYWVFFSCNAIAFASSLLVVAFILLLAVLHEKTAYWIRFLPLRIFMVIDLVSLMMAYAAGTCRDDYTKVYYSLLLAAFVVPYLILQAVLACSPPAGSSNSAADDDSRDRKILLLLATFAVNLTYSAGLNTPGGFWDNDDEVGHRAGDAILKEHHEKRLKAFFVCNTTAFVASLFIIVLLLDKKLHRTGGAAAYGLYGWIVAALLGLIAAYAGGSSRETGATICVASLVFAVLLFILLLQWFKPLGIAIVDWFKSLTSSWSDMSITHHYFNPRLNVRDDQQQPNDADKVKDAVDKARSLVLLLATLAATITYQAGLHPPGGVWQENTASHMAGDPILLTTNPKRYKAFFYCNSIAFVASLVVIVLVQKKLLLRHHVLQAAMVLDLFGLIGAYAAGTCREVSTSIYVIAMAGVVLVYVVIHVTFFTLDDDKCDDLPEKRRKRLLLFAILAATITYQAGLTPPSGFLLHDDESTGRHAGDPILLYNSVRRYTVFFYCNSASFMLSMALIILLVNPNLYRPAIRSYALSVCTAAGLFGLVAAFAVGSTQHRSTTIAIIVMASVLLLVMVLLLIVSLVKVSTENNPVSAAAGASMTPAEEDVKKKKKHAKRKYLMLLGILVASVTYQAGLDQPGGVWQSTGDGHDAGNPVMHDNRGRRYHVFFYFNSTAFVASIVIIILLLPWIRRLQKMEDWWFRVMNTTVLLDLVALLGAYAIGSSRSRKTSAYVAALVAAVLVYVVVHVVLSCCCLIASSRRRERLQPELQSHQQARNDSQNPA